MKIKQSRWDDIRLTMLTKYGIAIRKGEENYYTIVEYYGDGFNRVYNAELIGTAATIESTLAILVRLGYVEYDICDDEYYVK